MKAIVCWVLGITAVGVSAANATAQGPTVRTTYRLEYRTARYPQEVTTYRMQRETQYRTETRVTYKDVWENREQVRRYVVQKPVYETAERDENYVTVEPQTTYRTEYEDRGQWEETQVCQPGVVVNRLVFQPGGYVVDPLTGLMVYQPGGYITVAEQTPSQMVTQRTWKPAVVEVQKPQVSYVQKVVTRKVPFQTMKLVDEVHEERTPVRVCKRIPVEESYQMPYIVERPVAVKETRYVERVEPHWVPVPTVDPCTPCAGETTLEAPSLPMEQPMRVAPNPGPVTSGRRPTEAGAATGNGEGSVIKDDKTGSGSGSKPALGGNENPSDLAHQGDAADAKKADAQKNGADASKGDGAKGDAGKSEAEKVDAAKAGAGKGAGAGDEK